MPYYTFIAPAALRSVGSQCQVDSLLASIPLYQYNVAKAKAELAESAFPHSFSGTLLEYNATAVKSLRSSALSCKRLGLTCKSRRSLTPPG